MPVLTPPRKPVVAALETARLRRLIWRMVCSASWFDRCWALQAAGRLRDLRRPDHALDRAAVYPPGGTHRTLMRRCLFCKGRWQPPYYLNQRGVCDDCAAAIGLPVTDERTHVRSTESPSARALQQLEHLRVRLIEPPLAAEDEASLRREIAAHGARSGNTKNRVCE